MPGLDYNIFAFCDLSMRTSDSDGGASFLAPYASGSKLRINESSMDESTTTDAIDPTYGFDEFIRSMDIIVCGRGHYDQIMHQTSGKWPYPQQRLIVFTETPLTEPAPACPSTSSQPSHHAPPSNAEAFAGTPAELAQKLSKDGIKSRKFKRQAVWVMGGPKVRGAMLELGEIGRVELVIVPRIMTSSGGVPLWSFGGDEKQDVELDLIDSRSYENGVVSLSYIPGHH
ncbi:hypothetical protein M408DRAFT_159458 [Serendipita vermifera MAFF 305830]|uniref:Uncharacterized protein n=1 Tax=Serendipita vermifera MAFF 305830 TaxID=933852 RepID=A0A0C2WNJ0_SERVB|nr:hypothetical protein M408DRAFT_159458 [Serendipita vermifera MAFF 305830]